MADRHRSQTSEQKDTHDYPYGTEPDASLITPVEEAGNYVNSIDKALYLSYERTHRQLRKDITAMRCRLRRPERQVTMSGE